MSEDFILKFRDKKEAMSYFIMVLDHICQFGDKDYEAQFFNPNKGAKIDTGVKVVWGR